MKGVKSVTQFNPKSKAAVVEYDPQAATVQQLAQVVADTPGLHGKPYQATLLLHVDDLSNSDTQKKISEALKDVKGISAAPVDDKAGLLGVTFDKLDTSQGDGVKLAQILDPLREAGVKADVYLPPTS